MYYQCTKKEFNNIVAKAFSNNYELIEVDVVFQYYRIIDTNNEFYFNKDLLVFKDITTNTYSFYYYNKYKLVLLIVKAKKFLEKKSKKKS